MSIRPAFTMIELVFVIVVLGILAAVAIPRFSATRNDAHISKARATIAAVRSGIISERQQRLFRGDNTFINQLHHGANPSIIFDHNGTTTNTILMYGVTTQANANGHWQNSATQSGANWEYKYRIFDADQTFTYNPSNGTFTCTSGDFCDELTD